MLVNDAYMMGVIDLVYGLCYGTVKQFAPKGSIVVVRRDKVDNASLFDLQW